MSLPVSKKTIGYILLIAIVVALVAYYFIAWVPTKSLEVVRFVSPESETELSVEFGRDAATLTGRTFEPVVLKEAETASGRRFEDRATGLTLWYEGGIATLYERGAIIFTGTDAAALPPPLVPAENPLAEQLASVTWLWQETIMSDGTKVLPQYGEDFSVTLTDGSVVGTTDCNNFSGTYALTGAALAMGPFRMTRMYCANSLEQAFVDVLQGTTTVLFNLEGNLVLLLEDDAGSVFFTRATTTP